MSVYRIASRYAKSLIDLAVEQNKLDRILEDVQTFKDLASNREFRAFLRNPIIHADKKATIVHKILDGKYDKLTMAFFDILIRKGRESQLIDIATEFISQYKKIKHISTVRLTTAQPLKEESLAAIRHKLEESKRTEQQIELEPAVDPKLIGGFILEFNDNVYDASVAHKLDDLRKEFAENPYISKIFAR